MNRIALGLVLTLCAAAPALAQIQVPQPFKGENGRATRDRSRSDSGPAGVPGSRADTALAAPAERTPTDMPPTEALFDAVNRGDLPAAKEAIGRGADIHGRNILGLTPLEQSVDLGRNDISFLLLSLRGGAGYSTAGGPPRPAAPPSPAEARAERRAAEQARRQQLAEERQAGRARPAAPAQNARLFAGDGGAPVPQAGFLGFDSAR